MIDNISGERLVINNNYIIIDNSQIKEVEKIFKENGYIGKWSPSPSSSNIEKYSDEKDSININDISVWSVFLDNADTNKLQAALDSVN